MTARKPETVIDKSDTTWHLDRKVPIVLVVTLTTLLTGQGLTAAWWASKADSRIEALEKSIAAAGPQSASQGERLTRVEEKLVAVQAGILDIKSILQTPAIYNERVRK